MNPDCQARLVQPTNLVTSPQVNSLRRSLRSRQGNAGVIVTSGVGGPSVIVACGRNLTVKNGVARCKSKLCQTCPKLIQSKFFRSNVTNREYEIINHTQEVITCKSQNIVYLLTCEGCNIQYPGETTIPLHKRINIHRTSKKGCEHFIEHFSTTCSGHSFTIQVIEKLPSNGYDVSGDVCEDMLEKRLDREDYWMKELRTIYPYGLCERTKKSGTIESSSVGKLFHPLSRKGERPVRSRNNHNNHISILSKDEFFIQADYVRNSQPKTAMNHIRKLLDTAKKKVLKEIASYIIDNGWNLDGENRQWYSFILDIIDTKLYVEKKKDTKKVAKNICKLRFVNKGLEHLNLSKILNSADVISHLPDSLKDVDQRVMISYKLKAPIRNKILNYKEIVLSINTDNQTFLDDLPCECASSEFCDADHGHVITGDLRFIENSQLRSLLSKGPNYREPSNINYSKCLVEIKNAIDNCAQNMIASNHLENGSLDSWKNTIVDKVKERINILKRRFPSQRKHTLQDPNVKQYLDNLHNKFVIVTIDKAANNFAFICKKYYIIRLLSEVGVPNGDNPTYQQINQDSQHIISDNISLCEKYGLETTEADKCLPIMYWIPKMHKTPVDARFIIASAKCSTKPLSKAVTKVFKLIFTQTKNFHAKSKFYSKYNKFWVVENSGAVIEKLDKINVRKKAKEISTYDFKTLYTKIDHANLVEKLNSIIDFVFKGGKAKVIRFNDYRAYWSKSRKGKTFFTKNSLKSVVKHLIENCHFHIGNLLLSQIIGIPMGIDPAPFWANLFLSSYESDFMNSLIREDKVKALHYHGSFRFIDDKCCINGSGEFGKSFTNIYPPSLELKREHNGSHATFLDLEINIVDDIFVYKLYDKRDDFPFFIIRMPYLCSDSPSYIFYGTFLSEFLRISRCTLLFDDFVSKASALFNRMVTQGGNKAKLKRQINKVLQNHPKSFSKYNKTSQEIIRHVVLNNRTNQS